MVICRIRSAFVSGVSLKDKMRKADKIIRCNVVDIAEKWRSYSKRLFEHYVAAKGSRETVKRNCDELLTVGQS
jgi:hypothetical protein